MLQNRGMTHRSTANHAIETARSTCRQYERGDYALALERIIHQMADEASRLAGEGLIARPGCELVDVMFGMSSITLEVEFTPGEESNVSGPWENAHEGSPPELCVISALVNGHLIDVDGVFTEAQIAQWETEAMEKIINQRAEDYADARAYGGRE